MTILTIWVKSGIGSCLMMPSAEGNTVVASVNTVLINPHKIRPAERNGRKSPSGLLKMVPKIVPMHAIVTPIEMVIQNGPRLDLLYLCRMSA